MTKRKPSKTLVTLRKAAQIQGLLSEAIVEFAAESGTSFSDDWSSQTFLNAISIMAMMNGAASLESNLKKAFEFCGLDVKRPSHWRAFVIASVETLFRDPCAKEKWDAVRYYQLGAM